MNSEKSFSPTLIVVLLITLGVHVQSLFNDFHTDDWQILMIMERGFAWRSFLSMENLANFRPFANMVIILRSALFDRLPYLWYALNILLHLCATLLLYIFVKSRLNTAAAIVSALVFAVYFQHFEAVLWLYGIVRLIAAIMLILTLIYYFRFRQSGHYGDLVKSFLFYFLALLTVEETVIFAMFLGGGLILSRQSDSPKTRYYGAGYIVLVLAYLILRFLAVGYGNTAAEYFYPGWHILKNFYGYCTWIVMPQLNHPYLAAFATKYLPFVSGFAGVFNVVAFGVFAIASIFFLIKGNASERAMLAFLLLSLIMPSMLDSKVSTKLLYIPSLASAALAGSVFYRLWQLLQERGRRLLIALMIVYLLAQAAALNVTIAYYRTTQQHVQHIVDEIAQLDVNWAEYDYLLLDNLPGRVQPGHALKYRLKFNVRLVQKNQATENLLSLERVEQDLRASGVGFILIDFISGKAIIREQIERLQGSFPEGRQG